MFCIHKKTGAEAPAALGEEVYERHDRLDQLCHYDNERGSGPVVKPYTDHGAGGSRNATHAYYSTRSGRT